MIKAYECGVRGTEWATVIHHLSSGKAKSAYLSDVRDAWPSVQFTDITCRKLGKPRDTDGFTHTAQYRNVSFHIGSRVRVGDSEGFVVESNSSANFNVVFTSGKYRNLTLNCHPSEIVVLSAGEVEASA